MSAFNGVGVARHGVARIPHAFGDGYAAHAELGLAKTFHYGTLHQNTWSWLLLATSHNDKAIHIRIYTYCIYICVMTERETVIHSHDQVSDGEQRMQTVLLFHSICCLQVMS